MVNYQNGKIYSIRSYQTDKIYIGSTCRHLSKRMHDHKKHYRYWQNGKIRYVSSFDIIKYNDAYIELVEDYPCNNKNELCRREGELIREMDNVVNKYIPCRTEKEWREDNKDKIKERDRRYYEDNKDKIKERDRRYYEDNKEYIKQRYEKNKDKIKQYREDSKDKIKEQKKRYRENNKDRYKCFCCDFKSYDKRNLNGHLRTNKHKNKYNKYIYEYSIKLGASIELANDIAYN